MFIANINTYFSVISHFIRRNNNAHNQSFSVKHDVLPHFLKLWHHHQELELVLIIRGEGTGFFGDKIIPFKAGDLVLIGDYLPHKWQNNSEYFEEKGLIAEAIIIHFEKSFLSNALEETIEFKSLYNLIKSADRGINFKGTSKSLALKHFRKILKAKPGLNRMISLLDLLGVLASENDYEYITNPGYINSVYEKDLKLRKVNDFVMNNFQSPIRLKDVANEACMNVTAFCRYFKNTTDMTFSKYLNEIRIGYACKLLQEGNDAISRICYESGFSNLSNFNHKFKQFTGLTPSEYMKVAK